MPDEHHEVRVGDQSCLVHTSDMDESKNKEVISALGSTLTTIAYQNYEPGTYLYRTMSPEEFDECVKIGGIVNLDTGPRPQRPITGEKWLTESLTHAERFRNRGVTATPTVGEFRVKSEPYKRIRENAIPQQGSKALNTSCIKEGQNPLNLWNTERLKDEAGKQNIGLKGNANIHEFNSHTISVKQVDPASAKNQSAIMHWFKNNKLTTAMIAIGVVLDGTTLILSDIEDKGIGKRFAVSVAEIGMGHLGSHIGGLIGTCFLPGLGTVIGNIIGGIIGSLLGSLTSFFFGYSVAPGLGQPVGQSMADHGTPPAESRVSHGAPKSKAQVHHGLPQGYSNARHRFPTPSHQVRK